MNLLPTIGDIIKDKDIKAGISKYWMLIEGRRNTSYVCRKSSIDRNAGKSTPEPWYRIEDNAKAGDCKGKNTNSDCTLMSVVDHYLIRFALKHTLLQ